MAVGRSLAWMGGSQVVALLLQFGAQVVLVRHLTLHEAGVYAIGLAVVGVLSIVQSLSLQAVIVREPVLTPELAASSFTINAAICALLSLMIVAASFLGATFFGDPGVRSVLLALALTPLIGVFSFLPTAVLERNGRFREIALAQSAGSIAGAAATVTFALTGFTYMSAAYAQWFNAGANALLILFFGRAFASLRISVHSWRRIAAFAWQVLFINGVTALGQRLSDVLLGRILGLSALGLYSRAGGLNALIWTNVHLLAGRVMLVDFVDVRRRGDSLRERYMQTVDVTTLLLWPIFAGFAVVSGPFIQTIYGVRWVPAAAPLALLSIASMVLVAVTMVWELFTATDQLRIQSRIEFIRSLVAMAVFIAGCFISLEAAAAARVVDALFAVILYRPHLNRMTDTSARDFMPIYARNLAYSLVAIAPAAGFLAMHGWRADVALLPLGGAVLAGLLLWLGVVVATGHPFVAEVRRWRRR